MSNMASSVGKRPEGMSNFYVYLLSNASTDLAPDNTLTHFRNYLAKPIHLPKEEHWYVSLSSLYMSNVGRGVKNCALDIICQQLEQSVGFNPSLSVHARSTNTEEHIYEPINKQYFKPKNTDIRFIDVCIQNISGEKIELDINQPTIVVLEFTRMKSSKNVHTLKISNQYHESNVYKDINTDTNFRCKMPQELSPNHRQWSRPWEMALGSITFEPKFDQESPPSKNDYKFYFMTSKKKEGEIKNKRLKSENDEDADSSVSASMEKNNVDDLQPFSSSDQINPSMEGEAESEEENPQDASPHIPLSTSPQGAVKRTREKRSGGQVVKNFFVSYTKQQYISNDALGVQFKRICKEALIQLKMSSVVVDYINGQISIDCMYRGAVHDLTIAMPEYMANMLGFMPTDMKHFWKGVNYVYITIKAGDLYNCPLKLDVNINIPKNMLIYVNCIDASLIGDNYTPILKSIPIKRRQVRVKNFVTYEPRHLEFRHVNFSSIDYLHFRIQKVDGLEMDCLDKMKIYMSLLFRVKR